MDLRNLDRSRDLLQGCTSPLLVTHIAPDGDAVGSLLGMGWALRGLDKNPTLVCQDPIPRRFDFLPGFERITRAVAGDFDLLISLDCSDQGRMGQVGIEPEDGGIPLLNIDHHVTNLRFGTVNLVDATAVSTSHILYRLFRHLDLELDERIATCLLTGLVTDTRGFRTVNVTSDVLRLALELMEMGAPFFTIVSNGLERRPLVTLRLWGAALSRLETTDDGVVWADLPLSVQHAAGCDGGGTLGLSSLILTAEEARVSVIFAEQDGGRVEVGFRARPGWNVARTALALGGGGHALAAGCLVPDPLEQAERQVLAVLREDLARQQEEASPDGARHPQSG